MATAVSAEDQIAALTRRLEAAEARIAKLLAERRADTAAAAGAGAGAGAGVGSGAATAVSATGPVSKAATNPGIVDKSALFASIGSIDQSSGKTAGLRHVTKDMKSSSTTSGGAPGPAASSSTRKSKAKAKKSKTKKKPPAKPRKPPKTEESRTGWVVENYVEGEVRLADVRLMQTVYIASCDKTDIHITSKCKGVVLDNCTKCRLVVHNVLSCVETVRCKSSKIYVKGKCPTVSIDKSESVSVILSAESRGTQLVTSSVSAVNVCFPDADGEEVEKPVPEQFVSTINEAGGVETRVSDLYR